MVQDAFERLLELPGLAPTPLRGHVTYTIRKLMSANAFAILPHSSSRPFASRDLPNASIVPYEYSAKGGRPSKSQKVARAKMAINKLETWMENGTLSTATGPSVPLDIETAPRPEPSGSNSAPARKKQGKASYPAPLVIAEPPDPVDYLARKVSLKELLPVDILRQAEKDVKDTMQGVEEYATRNGIVPDNGWGGLKRMQQEKSMLDFVKTRPSEGGPSGTG